jgi:chitinase
VSCEAKIVAAVYPSWKHSNDNFDKIPWDNITHIVAFTAYPLDDGNINVEEVASILPEIVKKAHQTNTKVILSIGGAGIASKGFVNLTKNKSSQNRFIKEVTKLISIYNIDGIDIDWEYWTYQTELGKGGNDPIESRRLVELLRSLRDSLGKGFLLTTDIVAGHWYGPQFLPEIQRHVDYVNLMAFDFTGPWGGSKIAHHADYPTFKKAIDFTVDRGFQPNKILIGLPAYGIHFEDGKAINGKHIDYREIVSQMSQDTETLEKGKLDNLFWETTSNIERKAKKANQKNLAGIFIFEITSDVKFPELSLLHATQRYIQPIAKSTCPV